MGDLEQMQAFIRVVEAGGISRAAEQMGMAKSAVSRRLAELETRLGVKLMNRTTRASVLTDIGKSYYQRAVRIADDLAELDMLARDEQSTLTGHIRVAAPVSFGISHLGPAVNDFLEIHPSVVFDLDFSDRHVDLVQEGIDVALRIGELPDSTLQARKITSVNMGLYASPDYVQRHGMPSYPEALKTHNMLQYAGSSASTLQFADKNGLNHSVKPQFSHRANNGDFLIQLAIAGQGITISPDFISWQALRDGLLVEVLTDYSLAPINAYALYPKNRYLAARTRVFIEYLAKRFGENPYWR